MPRPDNFYTGFTNRSYDKLSTLDAENDNNRQGKEKDKVK